MRQPGYDTFGPQYPPEWDEPEPICSICEEYECSEKDKDLWTGEYICRFCREGMNDEEEMPHYRRVLDRDDQEELCQALQHVSQRGDEGSNGHGSAVQDEQAHMAKTALP